MADFHLHITLGNDAMQTNEHVAEALRAVAEKVEPAGFGLGGDVIFDANGNVVGSFGFEPKGAVE